MNHEVFYPDELFSQDGLKKKQSNCGIKFKVVDHNQIAYIILVAKEGT